MKRLQTFVLALALLAAVGRARAQDKSSHTYTVVVGHIVTLTWTAAVGMNVTSYNVFVSGTSGGPYTEIGSSTTTTFVDRDGIAGNTYYYVVTAVNSYGESGYSAEVSATLPKP